METYRHQRTNRFQSILMVLSMATIMGISGLALGGTIGLLFALLIAAMIVIGTGRVTADLVLRMYRASPISRQQAPGLMEIFDLLVKRAGLEYYPQLYYVPSAMMNAFATGQNANVSIAVTDGMVRNLSAREVAAVLAHEISHIKHGDVFVMSLADAFSRVTTMMGQAGMIMLWFAIPAILLGFNFTLVGVLILILAPTASTLLQLALSRSREYEADLGAAQITGDPIGLAMALKKIEHGPTGWLQQILMPGRKSPEPALLRTHPHTEDRVERLKDLASSDETIGLPEPHGIMDSERPTIRIRQPRWHINGLWY